MQETQVQSLGWEDPLDRGSWQATVHGVVKSRARLSTAHTHTSVPHCMALTIVPLGPASGFPSGQMDLR